jgi:hypothetical protein
MPHREDTYSGFPERLEAALEQSRRDRAAQDDTAASIDAEIAFAQQESELLLGMIEMFLRLCEDQTGAKLREGWQCDPDSMQSCINQCRVWLARHRDQPEA